MLRAVLEGSCAVASAALPRVETAATTLRRVMGLEHFDLGGDLHRGFTIPVISGVAEKHVPDPVCGCDAGVVCVARGTMQRYNNQYRKRNTPTDILSFPALELDVPGR